VSATSAALAGYRKKPFSNIDGLLVGLFALLGVVELIVIYLGNQVELKVMSDEEVKEFFARRFTRIEQISQPQVETALPEMLTTPSDLAAGEGADEAEEVAEVLEQPVEQQRGSVEQKAARRATAAERRAARREAISQQVINATGGVALVTGSGGSAASGLVDAAQVTAGGAVSTEGLVGMVTGQASENVRRLKDGGAAAGGSGGVDLQGALTSVDAGVAGGTVGELLDIEVQTYDRSGRFAAENARSPEALRAVIAGYQPGLKDCFEQQLQRDRSLRGSVLAMFTIKADGSVANIEFKRQNWTDPRLGRRVESCMERKIASWRFEPIDAKLGDFPMGQRLTFGS
jgi:hypothetical protein